MQKLDGAWEDLFWGVFQTSSNPIAVLDDRERVVAVNDAAVELVGSSRLRLLGSPMAETFSPDTRAAARRDWQEMLRSGEYVGTRRLRRADGAEIDVEYASRLVRVPGRVLVLAVALPATRPSFSKPAGSAEREPLSKREHEVVDLITLGMETPAIAKRLYISEHTVRAHVRNAMQRLGAHTRAHLVAIVLSDRLSGPGGPEDADGED